MVRARPGDQRERAGDQGQHEQHPDSGQQRPQAAVLPSLTAELTLSLAPAGADELALELVEVPGVHGAPVQSAREPGTAIKLGRVTLTRRPLAGTCRHMRAEAPLLAALLQPRGEPRPFPQQRLVRNLDLTVTYREQARPDQLRENAIGAPGAAELGDRHPPPGDGLSVAGDEAEHDRAGERPVLLAQPGVDIFGQAGDRTPDAARAAVALELEEIAVPHPPELKERGRQKRQPAGLADDVGHERLGERALDLQPGTPCGEFDRPG